MAKQKTYLFSETREKKECDTYVLAGCEGVGALIEKIEKKHNVLGVIFQENKIGIVIEEKK